MLLLHIQHTIKLYFKHCHDSRYIFDSEDEDTADDSDDDDVYSDIDESLQPTQGQIQDLLRQ